MLESLINPESVERRPYEMFFLAAIIVIVATGMAHLITGGTETSYLIIAFTCIGSAPLMVHVLQLEEKEDEVYENESEFHLLHRHGDVLEVYAYYFLGTRS